HAAARPALPDAVGHALRVVLAQEPGVAALLEAGAAGHALGSRGVERAARRDVASLPIVPARVLEPAVVGVVLELPGARRDAALLQRLVRGARALVVVRDGEAVLAAVLVEALARDRAVGVEAAKGVVAQARAVLVLVGQLAVAAPRAHQAVGPAL